MTRTAEELLPLNDPFRGGLRQILVLGAANDDANTWQRTAIRALWLEKGPDFKAGLIDWPEIEKGIVGIMGEDWAPSGNWAERIAELA